MGQILKKYTSNLNALYWRSDEKEEIAQIDKKDPINSNKGKTTNKCDFLEQKSIKNRIKKFLSLKILWIGNVQKF